MVEGVVLPGLLPSTSADVVVLGSDSAVAASLSLTCFAQRVRPPKSATNGLSYMIWTAYAARLKTATNGLSYITWRAYAGEGSSWLSPQELWLNVVRAFCSQVAGRHARGAPSEEVALPGSVGQLRLDAQLQFVGPPKWDVAAQY
jgi:hypothetical protein